jgi:hypothetical protein
VLLLTFKLLYVLSHFDVKMKTIELYITMIKDFSLLSTRKEKVARAF